MQYEEPLDPKDQQLIHAAHQSRDWTILYQRSANALRAYPSSYLALNMAAIACFKRNHYEKAAKFYKLAINVNPNDGAAYCNLGILYAAKRDFADAEKMYLQAIEHTPSDHKVHNNLGNVYIRLGKFEKALTYFKKAIKLSPGYAEPYCNMSHIYFEAGRFVEAGTLLQKAVELDDTSTNILESAALHELWCQNAQKALEYLERACLLEPYNVSLCFNLARAYVAANLINFAKLQLRTTLEECPGHTDAIRLYASIAEPVDFDLLEGYIQTAFKSCHDDDLLAQSHLNFALADVFDKKREFKLASEYYIKANSFKSRLNPYCHKDEKFKFSTIQTQFRKFKDLQTLVDRKELTQVPVFIVGMPRSGTSIIEQCLSQHSNVFGGGELDLALRFMHKFVLSDVEVKQSDLFSIRNLYLNAISQLPTSCKFVIDKMPHNFRLLGLLLLALPEAKFIHTSRSRNEVCISNFKQCFSSETLNFSNNYNDTQKYYDLYLEMMEFWRSQCAIDIFEISYEEFKNDPEEIIQKCLLYMGLDFEQNCTLPHLNPRSVRTASQSQVRTAINEYSSSSDQYHALLGV